MDTKCEQTYACVILYHVEKDIIIRVGGVYISVLEHCKKRKFRTFLHLTLISKKFMMSRFRDIVVCSTNLYICTTFFRKCNQLMNFLRKSSISQA